MTTIFPKDPNVQSPDVQHPEWGRGSSWVDKGMGTKGQMRISFDDSKKGCTVQFVTINVFQRFYNYLFGSDSLKTVKNITVIDATLPRDKTVESELSSALNELQKQKIKNLDDEKGDIPLVNREKNTAVSAAIINATLRQIIEPFNAQLPGGAPGGPEF